MSADSETAASPACGIALPESWRLELLLSAQARQAVTKNLEQARENLRILDWGDRAGGPNEIVLVAALDLTTAELLLKLPPSLTSIGIANTLGRRPWPFGGRRRLLARARRVPLEWLAPAHPAIDLPRDLHRYLLPALRVARRAIANQRSSR